LSVNDELGPGMTAVNTARLRMNYRANCW